MNEQDKSCFHCGLPNDHGQDFPVVINNQTQFMCCPGCQAVAESIVTMGLTDYYQFREKLPEISPRNMDVDVEQMLFYDHQKVQARYLKEDTSHHKSIALMVSGIVCAACTWLIETRLSKIEGISQVSVNQSTSRAVVRWDPEKVELSDILKTISSLGYQAQPYDQSLKEEYLVKEKKRFLQRLAIAGLGMMQVMMYSLGFYLDLNAEMSDFNWNLLRWVSLLISTPVVFYAASPFYLSALKSLKNKAINMDVPVAVAIFGAWFASCYATLVSQGEVYFDSVSMFVFFLLTGRYLQMIAIHKSGRVLEERIGTQPETAIRLSDNGEERLLLEDVQAGDMLLVKSGQQVPCDGTLIDTEAQLDESILTGESTPVWKSTLANLAAGAVNIGDSFRMKVTQRVENSTLANIVRLLQQARETKPRIQQIADKVASYFVIGILVLATATAIYWQINDTDKVFATVLAVLVITCPCALSLATPVAITTALGRMTSQAVLVNNTSALINLNHATDIVFDKTGTLTTGRFVLDRFENLSNDSDEMILAIMASLENRSEHPISSAFRSIDTKAYTVESVSRIPGIGLEGEVNGRNYLIGNELILSDAQKSLKLASDDLCLYLVSDGNCLARLSVVTEIRDDAVETLNRLKTRGLKLHMLSGDKSSQVAKMADSLSFDIDRVKGGVTPEEKMAYITELQSRGSLAVMVGDGLNDSPAMAAASVSIAMTRATDITKVNADMILMSEHLALVGDAYNISVKTRRIIKQNLVWAISYNLLGVPLAVVGMITPWIAALGMSFSSLIVVLNALRLSKKAKV